MMYFVLAILLIIFFVAGYGLFQLIYQQHTHDELEAERRRKFMQRYSLS